MLSEENKDISLRIMGIMLKSPIHGLVTNQCIADGYDTTKVMSTIGAVICMLMIENKIQFKVDIQDVIQKRRDICLN